MTNPVAGQESEVREEPGRQLIDPVCGMSVQPGTRELRQYTKGSNTPFTVKVVA